VLENMPLKIVLPAAELSAAAPGKADQDPAEAAATQVGG
jgi:hypothetical protein